MHLIWDIKWSKIDYEIAIPSKVEVPLPNSSITTKLLDVALEIALFVYYSST